MSWKFTAMVALVLLVVAAGVMAVGAADGPSREPLESLSASPSANGPGCHVSMRLHPGALDRGDRIVVELGHHGDVITRSTTYGVGGVPQGANVTIYGIGLEDSVFSSPNEPEVLAYARLGPNCEFWGRSR